MFIGNLGFGQLYTTSTYDKLAVKNAARIPTKVFFADLQDYCFGI